MANVTPDNVVVLYNAYLGRNPRPDEIQLHATGGFRKDPAGLEESIANSPEAWAFRNRAPEGGGEEGGGFEFPEFPSFEMSDVEKRHFDLLNTQIEKQIAMSDAENARVAARRSALDKQIRARYGMSLEDFEGQESFRSAEISKAQSERLQKALAGELPVDPALERQITEDERTVRSKLLAQVGPGYETSTPGIQSLADFRQRAEELRSAARRDEIAAGISPSAASAQFGLSLVGSEAPMDTTSISQALQAQLGSRQVGVQAAQARSQAMLAAQEMAQRERLAMLDYDLKRQQLSMVGAGGRGTSGGGGGYTGVVRTGGGYGQLAGTVLGGAASSVLAQRRGGDPFYT
jgi:hypothetical protein